MPQRGPETKRPQNKGDCLPRVLGFVPWCFLFSLHTAPWAFSFLPVMAAAIASSMPVIPNPDLPPESRLMYVQEPLYMDSSQALQFNGSNTDLVLTTKLSPSSGPLAQQMLPPADSTGNKESLSHSPCPLCLRAFTHASPLSGALISITPSLTQLIPCGIDFHPSPLL